MTVPTFNSRSPGRYRGRGLHGRPYANLNVASTGSCAADPAGLSRRRRESADQHGSAGFRDRPLHLVV